MGISEEIKQPKFSNEYQKLMVNILFTGGWLNNLNTAVLKPYKISPQQYNILRILRGQRPNPSTIMLLQDRMLDKMSNASRLVEKLKQRDLVDRTASKIDRRAVDVVITEKGLQLLKEMDKVMVSLEKRLHGLSTQEAAALNDLLDNMRDKS